MILNTPIHADVFEFIHSLDSQSIQTVVSSPPFYGLRNYKIPDRIWDATPGCEHEWEGEFKIPTKAGRQDNYTDPKWDKVRNKMNKINYTQMCKKCFAWKGVLGSEPWPGLFIKHLVDLFRPVREFKLHDTGTMFINMGDSYAGAGGSWGITEDTPSVKKGDKLLKARISGRNPTYKPPFMDFYTEVGFKKKDQVGVPWAFALAMRQDGWYLRRSIIWEKPNVRPSGGIFDRPTESHEYIFLFSKKSKYFYDRYAYMNPLKHPNAKGIPFGGKTLAGGDNPIYSGNEYDASKLEGKLLRDVWTMNAGGNLPKKIAGEHFAIFPEELPYRCILLGSPHQVCSKCRSPYVRIVEKGKENLEAKRSMGSGKNGKYHGKSRGDPKSTGAQSPSDLKRSILKSQVDRKTIGFEPTCTCDAPTCKPIVFDPFLGTATTAVVAEKLNRDWVGCDIAERFIELGKKRLQLQVRKGVQLKQMEWI